ncbi:transcriptional adaptor 2 [Patellaria atrata CBS 101060]|uniref:Transcriptional adapter 2 n=1 Tax=Patellaria atrata CBS 101060 TaxID=1346257 RepID=A0A9P4VKA3_9PEZI|nr:transcriptional adaptor 2 [Patellaria atrata CBS 101060]
MGVIKKKTLARGSEGGVKYVCDVCSADITSTVRIRCANPICNEYDLCVPCFSHGKTSRDHDPRTHSYQVIEQHSIPIFTEDWGADEELALLEGAETYGLGSWADIADHIGGMRTKDEVRDHYYETYIGSSKFPLPERASPRDNTLSEQIPREEFQARKKRRIEKRKEDAKNAPLATPKTKPTTSVPSCHEVQGYMPARLEFETEYFNDAEEAVQHMQFDPGDGINPRTGEMEPDMELKMRIMEIYNHRLTARIERKKVIFEHELLEYKRNTAIEKKRSKEERELMNKTKPFAGLLRHKDFVDFTQGIEREHELRVAIARLQEWRTMQIGDLKAGEKYEQEKQQRALRGPPLGAFDRLASNRLNKPTPPVDGPFSTSALTAPDLPVRLQSGLQTPPDSVSPASGNGATNGQIPHRPKFPIQPLPNTTALKFNDENSADLQLLTSDEKEVCSNLRLAPKAYLALKELTLKEAMKNGGIMKRKAMREFLKVDLVKVGKLYDFFVWCGWIAKG